MGQGVSGGMRQPNAFGGADFGGGSPPFRPPMTGSRFSFDPASRMNPISSGMPPTEGGPGPSINTPPPVTSMPPSMPSPMAPKGPAGPAAPEFRPPGMGTGMTPNQTSSGAPQPMIAGVPGGMNRGAPPIQPPQPSMPLGAPPPQYGGMAPVNGQPSTSGASPAAGAQAQMMKRAGRRPAPVSSMPPKPNA